AASAEEVKIGALMSMTGDLQAYGETSLNGIKLAVKQVNEAGGAAGNTLAVAVGDDQTNPQVGVDAAKKLVEIEKVVAVVGGLASGVTIPVAKSVSAPAGVVQISGASTSPALSGLEDSDVLFRTIPSDAFQGVALASVVSEKGVKNVSVLYINNDYGEGLAKAFASAYEAKGGKVSANLAFEPGNASYRGELQKAADGGPEALVLIAYPENGNIILKQSLEEGFFKSFVFTDGMKAPEVISAIGAANLNGSFGTAPEAVADSAAAKAFRDAYQKEFGELPPKPFIDSVYDATMLIALAMEKAGSADRKKIHEALRDVANPPGEAILPGEFAKAKELLKAGKDIDYVGAAGAQDFDKMGDVGGTFAHWNIDNGEIKTVKVFAP
ncbi:MAG: amino acid ABC transporter substrate-binding protein, partial [Alphaproteobacteria bacterium]|nr:amino acid ABC transporter substrate-binding protein [Alphaproteobacteria bacterium]